MNQITFLNYLFIENDIRVYNTHLFMKIYNREIGISKPTYFIAEIDQTLMEILGELKKLIRIAADHGADAVKFQQLYSCNLSE